MGLGSTGTAAAGGASAGAGAAAAVSGGAAAASGGGGAGPAGAGLALRPVLAGAPLEATVADVEPGVDAVGDSDDSAAASRRVMTGKGPSWRRVRVRTGSIR